MEHFDKRISEDLEQLGEESTPENDRRRANLKNLLPEMKDLIGKIIGAQSFNVFDARSVSEVMKAEFSESSIGIEEDLFNAIRVSPDLPFVVMNRNRVKAAGYQGLYISDDRRFKIYENDSNVLGCLIEKWKGDRKENTPNSIRMKVKFDRLNTSNLSYVDVVYRFGEGLFVEFKRGFDAASKEHVTEILKTHLGCFKITGFSLHSITSFFIIDQVLINRFIMKHILYTPYGRNRISFAEFLWPNEKKDGMAQRTRFPLRFKLGGLKASLNISTKDAKTNDVFYLNNIPVRLSEGSKYTHIKISDVTSSDDVVLIRYYIAAMVYIYANTSTGNSLSSQYAYLYSLYTGPENSTIRGSVIEPSKLIRSQDLQGMQKSIAKLKAVDPGFYGKITTGEKIPKKKQPDVIVQVSQPGWQKVLASVMSANLNVQIMRYPFEVSNMEDSPITNVPPYFLMCTAESPNFELKPNENSTSGEMGTFHPYLIRCTKSHDLIIPGKTPQERYNALIDLSKPFVVTVDASKGGAGRTNYKIKTPKILKPLQLGVIPKDLEDVLGNIYKNKISFERVGSLHIPDSLLDILAMCSSRPNVTREYQMLTPDQKAIYIRDKLKPRIVKETNMILCKQELYDLPLENIKARFLSSEGVDSCLFIRVLESFFRVSIYIALSKGKCTEMEVPRHKFFHIRPNSDPRPCLFILKHRIKSRFDQYERMRIFEDKGSGKVESGWSQPILTELFDRQNETVEIGFSTTMSVGRTASLFTESTVQSIRSRRLNLAKTFKDIRSQFIDQAGKVRAIFVGFADTELIIAHGPLRPIDVVLRNSISDVEPNEYSDVVEYLRSMQIKPSAYRVDKSGNGVWFVINDIEFFMPTTEFELPEDAAINNNSIIDISTKGSEFARYDYLERTMNVMIQLIRNLYIYSSVDDPDFFASQLLIVDEEYGDSYDLKTLRRKVPRGKTPETFFKDTLKLYIETYPTFFSDGKVIIASAKAYKGIMQHLHRIQKLKENIISAAGWKIKSEVIEGRKVNTYSIDTYSTKYVSRGYDMKMLQIVDRLAEYFNRPDHIKHFYESPADYNVNGIHQRLFMSQKDIDEYHRLKAPVEKQAFAELTRETPLVKSPQYYLARNGRLFILQNCKGATMKRASFIVHWWKLYTVNPGYFSEEGEVPTRINVVKVDELPMTSLNDSALLEYERGKYAALLILNSADEK